MRQYAAVVLVVALISLTGFSVIGQEEQPLPQVVLAVEPVHELHEPTLAEAARKNDYVTFDALYREAKARGESVAAYDTLHELWSWSMSDPIGAFYGTAMHDRLAAAYPGYAKYISEQSITDDHGNVFYPTSETRAFLLAKALEERAPRVRVAEATAQSGERRAVSGEKPARKTASASAPKVKNTPVVHATPQPVVAETTAAPAAVPEAAPAVAPPTTSLSAPPSPLSAPAPATTAPAATPERTAQSPFATRGLLLLVIGLIGIGVLAVMLRTPRETPPVTILPKEPEMPVAPVEPIKRPAASAPQEPRATGSHG